MPDEIQHLCPACEDEQSEAKAVVTKVMGISVAVTPIVLLFMVFLAAVQGITMVLDDRLIIAVLAAYAAVIAAMFKRK